VVHTIGEVGKGVVNGAGSCLKSVGNFVADTAKGIWNTGTHAVKSVANGGSSVCSRAFDAAEYVSGGASHVLGHAVDGLTTGMGYAACKTASPYPKSLYAPPLEKIISLPTGTPLYGGQTESDLPSES